MLAPLARRLLLAVHLLCSVGWVGGVLAYLALAFAVPLADDPAVTRAAWIGMELVGWYVLAPLAVLSLLTGVALALGTRWGLLRHYWVVISLTGTTLLTVVLLLHLPSVSRTADAARAGAAVHGSDVPHALIGGILLIGILVLNVLKPRGLTRYGWRRLNAPPGSASAGPGPSSSPGASPSPSVDR